MHGILIGTANWFFPAQNFKSLAVSKNENHSIAAEPWTIQQGATLKSCSNNIKAIMAPLCMYVLQQIFNILGGDDDDDGGYDYSGGGGGYDSGCGYSGGGGYDSGGGGYSGGGGCDPGGGGGGGGD